MDRWACVDIVAFPLQLLLKVQPAWARLPCAVVEDDKPQALVQFVNARAYEHGVRPGQRYAAALALARDLQAGTIPLSQIARNTRVLADRLRRYSPHVEPSADVPGVFWLDARGLSRLYPSLRDWAQAVRLDMQRAGMRATVAVGFTRFGVYTLAKCHRGITVCTEAGEERAAVEHVPLSSVDFEPDARARLAALGIETMGAFLRLPGDGIRQRFGAAAHAVHQLAAGHRWAPLVPAPAEEPQTRLVHFDTPETNTERLIFIVKRLLDSLMAALVPQAHAIIELALWMKLDDRSTRTELVRPAAPTVDATQLLALVRLRLDLSTRSGSSRAASRDDALRLSAGIVTLRITATTCPATSEQRRLFPHHARRDPELANQAFARLRAEFGERAVVRARIGNAHLPAARFEWEPFDHVPLRASPAVVTTRPLVRRIYAQPLPLASRFSVQAPASPEPGAVLGPYVVSGGWWGGGVHRDYYFAPTAGGNLWWVYYDHRRQRFFLQGCVE
ncbi:MAG: DNA polymerase Y family protein [Vicinamibacterales bacterium]